MQINHTQKSAKKTKTATLKIDPITNQNVNFNRTKISIDQNF